VSKGLVAALRKMVRMAGGGRTRPEKRREAYNSGESWRLRRRVALLVRLDGVLHKALAGPFGTWPRMAEVLARDLNKAGVPLRAEAAAARLEAARGLDADRDAAGQAAAVAGSAGRGDGLAACADGGLGGHCQRWMPLGSSARVWRRWTTRCGVFWVETIFRRHAAVDGRCESRSSRPSCRRWGDRWMGGRRCGGCYA